MDRRVEKMSADISSNVAYIIYEGGWQPSEPMTVRWVRLKPGRDSARLTGWSPPVAIYREEAMGANGHSQEGVS